MSHPRQPLSFPKTSRQGFVYESSQDDAIHIGAGTPGQIITQEDVPPYIVVDHHIDNVLPARWPGRLWHVRILAMAGEQPAAYANYTRATSIEICAERSPALLFGPQGDAVSTILDRIPHLSIPQIRHLAHHATPETEADYDAAWATWLASHKQSGTPHAGVLWVHMGNGRRGSPLGHAFTLAHAQYRSRVRALLGSEAFELDEDGDECLCAPWSEALTTLLAIIMGRGAPQLCGEHSTARIAEIWDALPSSV